MKPQEYESVNRFYPYSVKQKNGFHVDAHYIFSFMKS